MTPKKNQTKSTKLQTGAPDASKSKEKQQQWINKNQINIKNKTGKSEKKLLPYLGEDEKYG